jgi:tRNA1Val (adenine37-N6)-methyltransferase
MDATQEDALLTEDSLFNGKLVLRQQKKGYRFAVDAVLLAGLTRVNPRDRVLELGTGCGVVALMLAFRGQGGRIVAIELQKDLAELAGRNVAENGLDGAVTLLEMDYRSFADEFEPESFDLVLANPPYRRVETGRVSPHGQKARARHEITGSVEDVFSAGKYVLPVGGRLVVIYPATRLVHLLVTAVRQGFAPKELVMIHSHVSGGGRLVHLECRKGGGEELQVKRPFFIYDEKGAYTEEMRRLYEEKLDGEGVSGP